MSKFKEIPHYPNYVINTLGQVVNQKGHTMTWIDNGKGYKSVKLYNGTRPQGRLCLVHRLVLSTWLPTDNPKLDVNHKDGDKSNNSLDNLEWVTKSENTRHAHMQGLHKKDKLSAEDVKDIREFLKNKELSYLELAEKYDVRPSIISKIALGRLYGYV